MGMRDWFKSDEQKSYERAAQERAVWEQRERAQRERDYMAIHGVRDLGQARGEISALDQHNKRHDSRRQQQVSEDTRGYASNRDRVFMTEAARGHHDQRAQSRASMNDLDHKDQTFAKLDAPQQHSASKVDVAQQQQKKAQAQGRMQ